MDSTWLVQYSQTHSAIATWLGRPDCKAMVQAAGTEEEAIVRPNQGELGANGKGVIGNSCVQPIRALPDEGCINVQVIKEGGGMPKDSDDRRGHSNQIIQWVWKSEHNGGSTRKNRDILPTTCLLQSCTRALGTGLKTAQPPMAALPCLVKLAQPAIASCYKCAHNSAGLHKQCMGPSPAPGCDATATPQQGCRHLLSQQHHSNRTVVHILNLVTAWSRRTLTRGMHTERGAFPIVM